MRALIVAVGLVTGCGGGHDAGHADHGVATDGGHAHRRDLALTGDEDMTVVPGPMKLSETGLYSDWKARKVAAGVVAFKPRYELWSDGAAKERWLAIPPGKKIDTRDMDEWVFPVGTKAWKQFTRDGKVLETRLLEKVYDNPGGWFEVAYRWRADGSDADAVPLGEDNVLGTTHRVPSREDCGNCHGGVADVLIGVSAIQLSSADGKSGALSKLVAMGALSNPPAGEFAPPGSGLVQDALGYLHGNCGQCHSARGEVQNLSKMRLRLAVADRTPEGTDTYRTAIRGKTFHEGEKGTVVAVEPGSPEKSQVVERMGIRDEGGWQMPPTCSKVVDAAGLKLVTDWITSLPR